MIFEGDFPPTLSLLSFFKLLTNRALSETARKHSNMTLNQIELLLILGQPLTMKQVADATLAHPSNVTVLVRTCAKQGWVERVSSKTDKRTKYVVLTPAGKKIRQDLIGDLTNLTQQASGITDATASKILDHLKITRPELILQ